MFCENSSPNLENCLQDVIVASAIAVPQSIFLDFDGAETSYHNADLGLDIDDIIVTPSGFDKDKILTIVSALNDRFGDDIVFTADRPEEDEYSTIYIGTGMNQYRIEMLA